jgi:antitoxin component YwqK of YwqJK toxin-antitoxin module
MKKILLFIATIILSKYCMADKSYDELKRSLDVSIENRNKTREKQYTKDFLPASGHFSGLYETKYSDGAKRSEISYKDGKADGLAIWWYQNGKKDRETSYMQNGVQNFPGPWGKER